jgi:ADP-heptose:LPS heptosyltransferase
MLKLVFPIIRFCYDSSFPELFLSPNSRIRAGKILNSKQLKEKSYITIHPGAKWLPKRWPIAHYRELIKLVSKNTGFPIVLLGGLDDEKYITRILDGLGFETVHPITSEDLPVSAGIIESSLLCVNNDSAAMHIAAAVGTSSISIFGPVSPDRCRPSVEEGCHIFYDAAFCSPCTLYYSRDRCRRGINSCMYEILPLDVFDKIESLIP